MAEKKWLTMCESNRLSPPPPQSLWLCDVDNFQIRQWHVSEEF